MSPSTLPPTFTPGTVAMIHKVLREKDEQGYMIGGKLEYSSLGFFLSVLTDALRDPGQCLDLETIRTEVLRALRANKIYSIHSGSPWTGHRQNTDKDNNKEETLDERERMVATLLAIRKFHNAIYSRSKAMTKAIAEQHGGIFKYPSLRDIMIKFGDAVDTASAQNLMEQMAAVHAAQMSNVLVDVETLFTKLEEILDELITYYSK
ncbi:hypothetical protein F5Y08DRAFT_348805 [Xylaria arbuscula]|nr:hypothetical protein F5Y08DRAFT_348805 [Xylaria arbuscula]